MLFSSIPGSFGIAISIASEGEESDKLKAITSESNVLLQFVGTLRDFRHILTVTNEPISSDNSSVINHVRYPPTPEGLTPTEDEAVRTPLSPMSSNSTCSSRPDSRPNSRASSRCPSRRSSLRRKQAIRNFITQSEPCTPFRQRSNSNNSVNFDPKHTSWNELHLLEKIQKAFTPSCEDLQLGSIDEALESLSRVRTDKPFATTAKFNGSLVWEPLMKPHIDLTPLAPPPPEERIIPEEDTSDEESLQDNSIVQLGSVTAAAFPLRPKIPSPSIEPPPVRRNTTSLRKCQLSQSLNCLAGEFAPPLSLSRQNSFNSFVAFNAGVRVPGSTIGARWESHACLSNMYNKYIRSMLNSRSAYFQTMK